MLLLGDYAFSVVRRRPDQNSPLILMDIYLAINEEGDLVGGRAMFQKIQLHSYILDLVEQI